MSETSGMEDAEDDISLSKTSIDNIFSKADVDDIKHKIKSNKYGGSTSDIEDDEDDDEVENEDDESELNSDSSRIKKKLNYQHQQILRKNQKN